MREGMKELLRERRDALPEIFRSVTELVEGFSDLGARLSGAAKELQDPGRLPPEKLDEEVASFGSAFAALRARVCELAEPLPVSSTRPLGEIASLSDLQATLQAIEDVVETEAKRTALEEIRERALMALDQVSTIAYTDEADFPPLRECQVKARDLSRAISEADWSSLPSDAETLAEGTHPFAALLAFVERTTDMDDAQWELLRDAVAESFGKALAAVASRGKLTIGTSAPLDSAVSADAAASFVDPGQVETPSPASEPLAEVTPPAFIEAPETPVTQEVEAIPAIAAEATSTETEVEVATGPDALPAGQVEEATGTSQPVRREVAAVYVELRGYSDFAEAHKPEVAIGVLTEYNDAITDLIVSHGGSVQAMVGDSMTIVFEDLGPKEAENVVRMSTGMRDRVGELIAKWRKRAYRLNFCVGIAQGSATVDAEGSTDSGDIDAVADLATRLCGEAKPGQILFSQTFLETLTGAGDLVDAEPASEIVVRGFDRPVTAYNLVRLKE